MAQNLMIGTMTMVVCMFLQCLVVGELMYVLMHMEKKGRIKTSLMGMSLVLITALVILLSGILLQAGIWAGVFMFCNEFTKFADAFYHSVVNFSTLGYGDMVMSQGNRLLGGLEATNGVLMFGLTTGVMYTLLNHFLDNYWNQKMGESVCRRSDT